MVETIVWLLLIAGMGNEDNVFMEFKAKQHCERVAFDLEKTLQDRSRCMRFVKLEWVR